MVEKQYAAVSDIVNPFQSDPDEQDISSILHEAAYSDAVPRQNRTNVQPIQTTDFQKKSETIFGRIDTNGDGYLDTAELATTLQSKQVTGQDAQIAAALYWKAKSLAALNDDGPQQLTSGITRGDLSKFADVARKQGKVNDETNTIMKWSQTNFHTADIDGDKYLTEREIEQASVNFTSQFDKTALALIQLDFQRLQCESNDEWGDENDGITVLDIVWNTIKQQYESPDAILLSDINQITTRTSTSQRGDVCLDLYSNPANPIKSINPEAVRQGQIGNCHFTATLASVANTNPESILKMIQPQKDGSYLVTFPGAIDRPQTVQPPTEAEMGLYNGGSRFGTWASIVEKAFGQYSQSVPDSLGRKGMGNTPAEGGADGGLLHDAMTLLTGRCIDVDDILFTSMSTTRRKLIDAFTANPPRAVTCAIWRSGGDQITADAFATAHAYSILAFDPAGPDGGTVTVRNPWGHDGNPKNVRNKDSATVKISLEKFVRNFSEIDYEQ